MRNAVKIIFAVVIICSIFGCGFAVAETLPKTAKFLPPDTILLIETDNFSQLKTQFEKTDLYKLYKDPSMAAFFDKAKSKLKEKVQKKDENNIYRMFYESDVMPQGRVAFAMVLNEQTIDANEPPFLVISQWGEKLDKIKKAVNKMLKKNTELGGQRKSGEDYRGVKIEATVDEGGFELQYCYIDDTLIMSTDTEILKFVIAHIKGSESPTLSSEGNYTTTMKTVGPHHDIDVFVNLKQIIKMAIAEDGSGKVKTAMTNVGFDNVNSVGIAAGLARNRDNTSIGKAIIKIDGEKKGVCKLLEAESKILQAPRFIPASVASATFFNLDIKKAFNELVNIVTAFSPGAAAVMYMPLLPPSPEGGPGVKLKEDIIDHIGSEIVFTQKVRKPFSKDKFPVEYLVALGVSNRGALERSMSLLHSQLIAPNDPKARRELLGHTIYRISIEGMPFFFRPGMQPMQAPGETTQTKGPVLAFTITDTHLIFGLEASVEQSIRTLTNTEAAKLNSAKWFAHIKPSTPLGLVSLKNDQAGMEMLWWSLKETEQEDKDDSEVTVQAGAGIGPGLFFKQSGLLDGSLLPEFDTVRKYFGLSTFFGVSRPDGFFFECKDFKSANEK